MNKKFIFHKPLKCLILDCKLIINCNEIYENISLNYSHNTRTTQWEDPRKTINTQPTLTHSAESLLVTATGKFNQFFLLAY